MNDLIRLSHLQIDELGRSSLIGEHVVVYNELIDPVLVDVEVIERPCLVCSLDMMQIKLLTSMLDRKVVVLIPLKLVVVVVLDASEPRIGTNLIRELILDHGTLQGNHIELGVPQELGRLLP